ncbi:ABC transporter ATP-binding protein [bacterium]|nr:ABC transporter ATP-binding protein [bacterium]
MNASDVIVRLDRLCKRYPIGGEAVNALAGVSFEVRAGEFIAITGPSGSGKSTLMHILGCLDRPTSGTYFLDGRDISNVSNNERALLRNRHIGFVFQAFNLLQRFTVLQNVELPMVYGGVPRRERKARAQQHIELVGLGPRAHHRPVQLSGGERQRAAIARALVNDPLLIFADEPTGNLDTKTGEQILLLFETLHRQGRTVIIVTHDPAIAGRAHRRISLRDGSVIEDVRQGPASPA